MLPIATQRCNYSLISSHTFLYLQASPPWKTASVITWQPHNLTKVWTREDDVTSPQILQLDTRRLVLLYQWEIITKYICRDLNKCNSMSFTVNMLVSSGNKQQTRQVQWYAHYMVWCWSHTLLHNVEVLCSSCNDIKTYSIPATRHAGMLVYGSYSYHSLSTTAVDGGERSASRPDRALPPGKGPRYPLCRRLGGTQSRWGHRGYRKSPLPPPAIEPRSPGRPARSQTLYWLSCPDHTLQPVYNGIWSNSSIFPFQPVFRSSRI
jgi:hypothetical protein